MWLKISALAIVAVEVLICILLLKWPKKGIWLSFIASIGFSLYITFQVTVNTLACVFYFVPLRTETNYGLTVDNMFELHPKYTTKIHINMSGSLSSGV